MSQDEAPRRVVVFSVASPSFPDLRCFALWVAVGRHFVQPV